MPIALQQHDVDEAILTLDLRVYSLTALKKAAYRLADRCTVVLSDVGETTVKASLLCAGPAGVDEHVRSFLDEALDQELREQIGASTAGLRDLILAHAFSRTRLVTG
jgi:His-Xaa-Ser system protein HxsD